MKNKKPKMQTVKFYDWFDSWEYIKEKYNLDDECCFDVKGNTTDMWNYILDNDEVHNGGFIEFSNWDIVSATKHGEECDLPEWYVPILNIILDEFGTPDTQCLLPCVKIAKFQTVW